MTRGGTTDWRTNAKGAHHWLDVAADIERRMQALVEEAATLDPNDVAALQACAEELDRTIAEFEAAGASALAEKQLLDAWIQSETSGILGRATANQFRAQFAEQYEIYGLLIGGQMESVAHYRQRLAEISPVTGDGLLRCPAGHENHPSRSSCLVCGAVL